MTVNAGQKAMVPENPMASNRISPQLSFSLEGQLLVASPSWDNHLFRRAVCLVVHHSAAGAVGIFLNRSMELDAKFLWQQISGQNFQADHSGLQVAGDLQPMGKGSGKQRVLHFGGPKSGPVVAVHNRQDLAEFCSAEGVYFAAHVSHLDELLRLPDGDAQLKIIVGQADWPAGALDAQFMAGHWLPLPVTSKLVFADSPFMWAKAIREVGNRFVTGITGAHGQPDDVLAN
jgi:putative transcriptional regulator